MKVDSDCIYSQVEKIHFAICFSNYTTSCNNIFKLNKKKFATTLTKSNKKIHFALCVEKITIMAMKLLKELKSPHSYFTLFTQYKKIYVCLKWIAETFHIKSRKGWKILIYRSIILPLRDSIQLPWLRRTHFYANIFQRGHSRTLLFKNFPARA